MSTTLPPVSRNPTTGEMFLPVRKRPDLILTPPRAEDAERVTELLQIKELQSSMGPQPLPYLLEHATAWLATLTSWGKPVHEEISEQERKGEFGKLTSCPFHFIRQVSPDGSDRLIGSFNFVPYPKEHLDGESYVAERGVWTIGNWLDPELHSQGIMTDVVETLLHDWAIPRLSVRKIAVSVLVENTASFRVFEKNGFGLVKTTKNAFEQAGQMLSLHTLEWVPETES